MEEDELFEVEVELFKIEHEMNFLSKKALKLKNRRLELLEERYKEEFKEKFGEDDFYNLSKETKDMCLLIRRHTENLMKQGKQACKEFLVQTGVYDENGNLTEHYQ